jgi:hypothetical protein
MNIYIITKYKFICIEYLWEVFFKKTIIYIWDAYIIIYKLIIKKTLMLFENYAKWFGFILPVFSNLLIIN